MWLWRPQSWQGMLDDAAVMADDGTVIVGDATVVVFPGLPHLKLGMRPVPN